ncbi:hypothetical protein [Micromonospora sp. NBC_01638]|uniref:hypothetical protein n=1 Tax=Micromonospora sp. NBC_01638 TaxID=2975982 RepID=UPI003865DB09|nr:hypothetical protein OG811_17545 [Micromonospora sp. NBC_01638]
MPRWPSNRTLNKQRATISEHDVYGSCERCRPDEYTELSWARDRVKAYRLVGNQAQRYEETPPKPSGDAQCG